MRFRKIPYLRGVIGGVVLGALGSCYVIDRQYDTKGRIIREDLFEPATNFGLVYRIEVTDPEGKTTPYVFIGKEQELRDLNRKYNVGDEVKIDSDTNAFSLGLEKVLLPSRIKKK